MLKLSGFFFCNHRADAKFVPGQWGHWLGASQESALNRDYTVHVIYIWLFFPIDPTNWFNPHLFNGFFKQWYIFLSSYSLFVHANIGVIVEIYLSIATSTFAQNHKDSTKRYFCLEKTDPPLHGNQWFSDLPHLRSNYSEMVCLVVVTQYIVWRGMGIHDQPL